MNCAFLPLFFLFAVLAMLCHCIGAMKYMPSKSKIGIPAQFLKGTKSNTCCLFLSSSSDQSRGHQNNNNNINDTNNSQETIAHSAAPSASSSTSHKGFGTKSSSPVIDPNRFKTDPKILVPNLANVIKETSFQKLVEDYQAVPAASGAPTTTNTVGRRVFDDALKFPCVFKLKIIGENDETFVNDVLSNIASMIDVPVDKLSYSVRESASTASRNKGVVSPAEQSAGKYISLTVQATFSSADQLYAAYDIAKLDKRIKYVM